MPSQLLSMLESMGIICIYLLIGFLFMVVLPLTLLTLLDFILKYLGV